MNFSRKIFLPIIAVSMLASSTGLMSSDCCSQAPDAVSPATAQRINKLARATKKCLLSAANLGLLALAGTYGKFSLDRVAGMSRGEDMLRMSLGICGLGYGTLFAAGFALAPVEATYEEYDIKDFELVSKLMGAVGLVAGGAIGGSAGLGKIG